MGEMFNMFFSTITNAFSIINRSMATLDNYACVAEKESIQYLKTNSATNEAELRDLKDSLGLLSIDE